MKVSPAAIYFFDAKSLRSLLVLCLSYRKSGASFISRHRFDYFLFGSFISAPLCTI